MGTVTRIDREGNRGTQWVRKQIDRTQWSEASTRAPTYTHLLSSQSIHEVTIDDTTNDSERQSNERIMTLIPSQLHETRHYSVYRKEVPQFSLLGVRMIIEGNQTWKTQNRIKKSYKNAYALSCYSTREGAIHHIKHLLLRIAKQKTHIIHKRGISTFVIRTRP